ncbi:MAG: GGDEF domain-containing protein [Spirochaetota bacterium]
MRRHVITITIVAVAGIVFAALNGVFLYLYSENAHRYPSLVTSLSTISARVQRAAKLELAGLHDETLEKDIDERLSVILEDLRRIRSAATDETHERALEVKKMWIDIKGAAAEYREKRTDTARDALMQASEEYPSTLSNVPVSRALSGRISVTIMLLGALIIVNSFLMYIVIWRLRLRIIDHVTHFLTHDQLTGILNRVSFEQLLDREISGHGDRYPAHRSSLIMLDLDCYLPIVKSAGRDAAERLLKDFTAVIRAHIRRTDIFSRFTDDRFVLVSLGSDGERACALGEKLRAMVQEHSFSVGRAVTMSVGVSELKADDTSASALSRVHKALSEAQRDSGNKTVLK